MIFTRLSSSSIQRAGMSLMRYPDFSARTKQLRVEEPRLVLDLRHDLLDDAAGDDLEAALGVGEAREQHALDEQVVGARYELALEAALDLRIGQEPRSGAQVVALLVDGAADRLEDLELGREVDVRVGDDVRVRPRPGVAQGAAASTLLEAEAAARRRTPAASRSAISIVPSVEPLSATVTCQG